MAFPTSPSNNQVHKEGQRAFVYDSAAGVWDQINEPSRGEDRHEGSGRVRPGGLKSIKCFQYPGSNTWTKPPGINAVRVYVTAGGGGGGGAEAANDFSGSGGGGGTSIKFIDVTSIASVTVTVGAGGAGASMNSNSAGGAGGASSFGSHCSASGGYGGATGNVGAPGEHVGKGGFGDDGDLNVSGGDGGHRWDNHGISTQYAWSIGTGGCSYWGGGHVGPVRVTNYEYSGRTYGAGGGGTVYATSVGDAGNGADGVVYIEEYS